MLKFLPGILILQVITIALVLFTPADLENWGWLRLMIPVLIAGFLTAFWFGSIAAHQRKDEISRLKEYHAKERETIRVNAERTKSKIVKQVQRKTQREVRRSSTKANIKVGLAFAAAAGLGGRGKGAMAAGARHEQPRACGRLQILRGWSYEKSRQALSTGP